MNGFFGVNRGLLGRRLAGLFSPASRLPIWCLRAEKKRETSNQDQEDGT